MGKTRNTANLVSASNISVDITNDRIGIGSTTPTSKLVVDGDTRITGILTIGTSSITLDGSDNRVNVGSGITLHHTNGIQVGGNTLHSTGLTINQINSLGVVTAANFVGNASGLTNVSGLGTDININTTGIITATGGFNIGISSAGTSITSGPVKTLNFVGSGNTFAVNGTTVNITVGGGGGAATVPTEILVVAGGGGGAPSSASRSPIPAGGASSYSHGGGGGGGQLIVGLTELTPGQTYTITVGSGGAISTKGNDSVVTDSNGKLLNKAVFGGAGNGGYGGCGGGAQQNFPSDPGNAGGSPNYYIYTGFEVYGYEASPGGDGAGTAGYGATTGYASSITGSSKQYGYGGKAGGMSGGSPVSGVVNTGGGGDGGLGTWPGNAGGSGSANGSSGGSGIVIIKYPNAFPTAPSSPGATLIPSPTHRIYQFTSSGSITLG